MKSLFASKTRLMTVIGIIVVSFSVGALALLLSLRYIASFLVTKYTDPVPRELPTLEVTQGEIKVLKTKWENFKEALKIGASSERLELTADELNVMLLTDPELNRFRGKVVLSIDHQNIVNALLSEDESMQYLQGSFYVRVKDGRIYADVSLPMKALGLGEFGDRFVNASGELLVTLKGRSLEVKLLPTEINGEVLPKLVLNRVREIDLYELFVKDHPVYGRLGSRIKNIEVDDDKVYLELTAGNGPLPTLPGDTRLRNKGATREVRNLKDFKDRVKVSGVN